MRTDRSEGQNRVRGWKLQAFGDRRQYGGNEGYHDEASRFYRYDSNVANHRRIAAGDIAILEDHHGIAGIARIEHIEVASGAKEHARCPACRGTNIKARKTLLPRYRCFACKREFDDPVRTSEPCTVYVAVFGESFVPARGAVTRETLRAACPRYIPQSSIQEVNLALIASQLIAASAGLRPLLAPSFHQSQLLASDADEETDGTSHGPYSPDPGDTRDVSLRQIRKRRGQRRFRQSLVGRYGPRCMITGCSLMDVVQAAHIDPYRGESTNHVENGLLLRSDLHDLFDLDLLGLCPGDLSIHIHSSLYGTGYAELEGRTLICSPGRRPSRAAMQSKWATFERHETEGGSHGSGAQGPGVGS